MPRPVALTLQAWSLSGPQALARLLGPFLKPDNCCGGGEEYVEKTGSAVVASRSRCDAGAHQALGAQLTDL